MKRPSIEKKKLRTVRWWLERLPDPPIRAAALNNLLVNSADVKVSSFYGAINAAFGWEESPEGSRFWNALFQHYRRGSAKPEYPTIINH